MKTRTRRFLLRLIVGLLTFLIGVFAAMVLGHFNPLDGQHTRPPQVRRCGDYARPAPPASLQTPVLPPDAPLAPRVMYPVYRPEAPPAPQPPAAPVLPSFEDEGEVKPPRPVAPSHRPR